MQSSQASTTRPLLKHCTCPTRPCRPGRSHVTRAFAQAEPRRVRLTVAGPPDGSPPRTIEVEDPLLAPAELVSASEALHLHKAGISKSEAREQAAIIQAQRDEIQSLRSALAETQEGLYKGKAQYTDVIQTKDMQIAQLYELAASGVRERARLRQELTDMQAEMQGTKRQLHAFMASLMQLKSSMDSAGDGDIEHALELLQSSSWSQSMRGAVAPPLTADEDVYMQLVQMQKLSDTLVQDMKQDEELMQQGLEPRSRSSSYDSFDSMESMDSPSSKSSSGSNKVTTPTTSTSSSSSVGSQLPPALQQRQQQQPQQQVKAQPGAISSNGKGPGAGNIAGSNGNGGNGYYNWTR